MGIDLALVNKELEDVVAERALLREKHKGATMPEEARSRDEELVNRGKKLQFVIEEEKQRIRDEEFVNTARYLDDPAYKVPLAVNADDDGRRSLQAAGWTIKGGFVSRMTSFDREQAMFPEEVLFGPIPTDPVAAHYYNQTRAVMQSEYRDAYVKYLKACATSRSESMAMNRLTAAEQNALSSGLDEQGGFLVPPDVQAEILARAAQTSVMRRLCRVLPTSRDRIVFPAIKANSSSGSIYSSGFVGGWAGETPAFSETDPTFQDFEIGIKKLRVATKLSNDWLADTAGNMLAFLAQNGGENMALVEDQGFIAGDGGALQPRGLLNAGISTIDVEGSTSNTISNSTSNTGSAPKLIDVEYGVPSQYSNNGSWLMSRSVEGKVRKLVDANGRYMWLSASGSGYAGTPRDIDGYPVYNSDFMEADGTDAAKVIAFGDFRNYIIGQRAAISTVVLRERFADTDQTGIILFERVGGGVWNTDAFRVGVV